MRRRYLMTRISMLTTLVSCLFCVQSIAAEQQILPRRVELSLLVLDDEAANVSEGGAITRRPPEHGAFVAMEMDCGSTGSEPCRPRLPVAVLTTGEGLKRFIAGLPPGTRVEWNGTCLGPFPREHPLSATGALSEIQAFALQHKVKLVVNKAG
jgi:hypothetical protein